MHARYCSPLLGRFLTVDRMTGRPKTPQSWNRYAYALDNPLRFVDPNGEQPGAAIAQKLGAIAYNLYQKDLLTPDWHGVAPIVPGRWIGRLAGGGGGRVVGVKGLDYFSFDLTGAFDESETLNVTVQKKGLGASLDVKFDGLFPADVDVSLLGLVFERGLTGQGNNVTFGIGAGAGVEGDIPADPLLQAFFLALGEDFTTLLAEGYLIKLQKEEELAPENQMIDGELMPIE